MVFCLIVITWLVWFPVGVGLPVAVECEEEK